MENTKLVWVPESLGLEYEKLQSDEERYKVFEEYLETVKKSSKDDFRINLDGLEEDVAMYTGLMIRVKQAFEKAKTEQLNASYDLWEQFEKELPKTQAKVNRVVDVLNPLSAQLDAIHSKLAKINIYDIERMTTALRSFNDLSEKSKKMFEFLVENYSE